MTRQFLVTAIAVLLGAGVVLWAYDRFVVQPRAAEADAGLRMDLSQARMQARQVAADLDASVQRSVADSRDAMQEQADEAEHRRLASTALAKATLFKTAVAEYYMNSGEWPTSPASAGLPAPDDTAGQAVRWIRLGNDGMIDIELAAPFAEGSGLSLTPRLLAGSNIDWHCASRGDPALPRYLPGCQ